MMLLENARIALSSLLANKMRALLTMLGIIIGIASVIAIMTVGNSVTSYVTDTMSSMGASNITVVVQQRQQTLESTEEGLVFGTGDNSVQMTDDDCFTKEMLENYCDVHGDSITAISAESSLGSGEILDGNLYANVNVSGVSLGYFFADDTKILNGRLFSQRELDEGNMVALISDKAAKNMYGDNPEDAIGSSIQVSIQDKYYNFTVVGIYEYEQQMGMISFVSDKDLTTNVYIPLKAVQELNHTSVFPYFTVVAKAGIDPDQFANTTKRFFDTYYRNNRSFEAYAFSMASIVENMTSMLSTITTAISVIAGIALLVGGIGVMNIMLVSITERTREIGTRKALGAPNSSIRLQFIVESIVICMIGGIIGIILGIVLGIAAAGLLGSPASPSVGSIIISLTFSMAIGVFFGYYPANKAAKMDPIAALRYE